MDTPTPAPEPPAQSGGGSIPRWLGFLAAKPMYVVVIGATIFVMWSAKWTQKSADEMQTRANRSTARTAAHSGAALSGPTPTDNDEEIAAKQAEIIRKQKELADAMAARNAQEGTVAASGQPQQQLSPEQQAREEIARERIRGQYASLWSSPIIATREATKPGAAPAPVPAAHEVSTPSTAVPAVVTGTDPNKQRFPYDESVGPYHVIQRYTMIGGTLQNQVNSQTGGAVIVKLDAADRVYVPGTKTELWPEGSELQGEARQITASGQNLVGTSFDRIRMPDGYTIAFPPAAGLSQNGQTGATGQVNTHWLSSAGWSILLAGFAGLSEIGNTTSGFVYSPEATFRAQFSESLGQQAQQQLFQRVLSRPSTVIIPAGTRMKCVLFEDLPGNPEYQNHRIVPGSI